MLKCFWPVSLSSTVNPGANARCVLCESALTFLLSVSPSLSRQVPGYQKPCLAHSAVREGYTWRRGWKYLTVTLASCVPSDPSVMYQYTEYRWGKPSSTTGQLHYTLSNLQEGELQFRKKTVCKIVLVLVLPSGKLATVITNSTMTQDIWYIHP